MFNNVILNSLIYIIIALALMYSLLRAFFYKSLSDKRQQDLDALKLKFQEAEIFMKKHQLQLNRGDGHIEILTSELNALKNDLKNTKAKNTQLRIEIDRHKARIKDLEQKLEALL